METASTHTVDTPTVNQPASEYVLYSDGACLGNPGPGGWGCVIEWDKGRRTLSGGEPRETTSNRMEMTAVLEGLKLLPDGARVTVVTDSKLVVQTMIGRWRRRKNRSLWSALDRENRRLKVWWQWERRRSSPKLSEVDDLARGEAAQAQVR